jgi:hypothetical protein
LALAALRVETDPVYPVRKALPANRSPNRFAPTRLGAVIHHMGKGRSPMSNVPDLDQIAFKVHPAGGGSEVPVSLLRGNKRSFRRMNSW